MTSTPLDDFTGKRVLVTGGSGDIGRAICAAFAARGARIAFTFFSSHDGKRKTTEAITAAGSPDPLAIRCNLRDDDAVDQIANPVLEAWGGVDFFVSNAASGVLRPTLELTKKHWDWTVNVNARSLLLLSNRLVPSMPAGGRILALSSMGAVRAIEHYAAVGASKAALEAVIRHLAMDLGPRGITANVISPGVVDTQALQYFPNRQQLIDVATMRTPNRRIVTPEDVANVAVLLASPLASMIQGQTIVVDGGYAILA